MCLLLDTVDLSENKRTTTVDNIKEIVTQNLTKLLIILQKEISKSDSSLRRIKEKPGEFLSDHMQIYGRVRA